ncbi:hypothetical protein TrLO_g2340 [Triparma laevis f. longispina]|uniref:Uncharacterized protein n=1 Tax=Triparma laevis f. longispina TaxID=1714387 RepID=A0A9W7KSS8_9STRA|nr:hypothetical protein TrLO_g2340 [Triparma laevis f. longispina]
MLRSLHIILTLLASRIFARRSQCNSLYGAVTTGGNWKSVFTKNLAEIHSAFGTDPLSGDAQVERLAVAYAEALKSYPPHFPAS